jgi:hypothetical protein
MLAQQQYVLRLEKLSGTMSAIQAKILYRFKANRYISLPYSIKY